MPEATDRLPELPSKSKPDEADQLLPSISAAGLPALPLEDPSASVPDFSLHDDPASEVSPAAESGSKADGSDMKHSGTEKEEAGTESEERIKEASLEPQDRQNQSTKKPVRGLVLGGGGAKGCYHVGAWQAFREMGISFDAVTGTSIGALVGSFYVQQDIEPVTDFVMGMKPTEIAEELPYLPMTVKEKVKGTKTVLEFLMKYMDEKMDITPLRNHFRRIFNYEVFSSSPVNYACMTYNDTLQEGQAFTKQQITADNAEDIIMASAACYPAFPKVTIGDQVYMDGGYADNVPIELLEQIQPEADERVVIDIHGPQDPMPPALTEDMKLIQPLLHPGNSLDFSPAHAQRLYDEGYLETLKYYDKLPGYLFTFTADDDVLIDVVERYLNTQMEQKQIVLPYSDQIAEMAFSAQLGYTPFELKNRHMEHYEYGRLVETLALLARMEPVALYSYKDFLIRLTEALSSLSVSSTNETDYRMVEMYSNLKREELPVLLHKLLVRNQGTFPAPIEAIRDRIAVSYTLAYVWYFLEELTRNLSGQQEQNSPEA